VTHVEFPEWREEIISDVRALSDPEYRTSPFALSTRLPER
jgi:hypothetical protein